ncbi:hypothetical protein FZEAL_5120 [Fusarium zealandicum]|uniref:J domain-containing protein n=1 Tax=Fusarium zealandicum TaxID=1053134 RepID=A0A8H4UKX4_9HYPO|nr:hypothetical protein FZEAL_5120 [Fusarium zealandicum]
MTDSSNRPSSLRVPRVRHGGSSSRAPSIRSSRAPSVRSSAAHDDSRHPSGGPGTAHSLRAASSRFSLNENFAATRQEYALWDDDTSSIYTEHLANASEAGDPEAGDKTLVSSTDGPGLPSNADDTAPDPEALDWEYYDMLCLPRDAEALSQDQIRSAYYRLFLLFYPDTYPENLRPIARLQFLRAQEAFETLIDPARRAQYDLDHLLQAKTQETLSGDDIAFKEAVQNRIQNGIHTSSDLGIRLDGTGSARTNGATLLSDLQLLDFSLSHSISLDVPALRDVLQPHVSRIEHRASSKEKEELVASPSQPTIEVATPTVTVTGSTYGVAGDMSTVPTALLYDRYQPLLPLSIPRHRLIQLVENRLSPLVTLRCRQEFLNRAAIISPDKLRWIKTAIELESDILPEFSATSRLYHHFALPNCSGPTILEASIQSSRHAPRIQPRVALGLHQNSYYGTGFMRADSGNWILGPRESWGIAKMKPNLFSAESLLRTAPSLELGFRTGSAERKPASGSLDSPGSESGIRGLDHELDSCKHGTWAVSAAATPTSCTGLVRYSKDLNLPFQLSPSSSDPGASSAVSSSSRLEVELCSNTFHDRYLALRSLWSVGRFARLGLEVGISLHSLHFSVYWSRLGQRLSVPLLIAPRSLLGPSILFCAGALPFAGLAVLELVLDHQRRQRPSNPGRRTRPQPPSAKLSSAEAHVGIARHRQEADDVTLLLAQAIAGRQKRQMSLGGLVILNAKFGIPDGHGLLATSEQVADVTIALAALMNEPTDANEPALVVPRGVHKSRLPGFWDPAPGRDKVLRVEYWFKGQEGVVEVGGRDELVLPPPQV